MLMAQDSAEPETAKLATEDASTASRGELELQIGYGRTEANRYFDQSNRLKHRKVALDNEFEAEATYGISDKLEASLSHGWASLIDAEEEVHAGQGSGDTALGFNWNFYSSDEAGLLLSCMPVLTLPTGESGTSKRLGVSQEYYSVEQLFVLTYNSNASTISADSGYVLPFGGERQGSRGVFLSDIAFGYQLTELLQPEVELNYFHGYLHRETDSDSLAITAGFLLNITKDWRIDLGIQEAIYGRDSDFHTSVLVNLFHSLGVH